jgi:hypothetical protein
VRGGIRVNCCAWYEVLVQYLIEVEGVLDLGDHAITEEGEPEESPSVQAAYQRRIHAHRMSDRIRDSFLFIWVLQSEAFNLTQIGRMCCFLLTHFTVECFPRMRLFL